MYTSIQLLDMAKAALNLPSDYAVAKKLGITTQSISLVRCKRNNFGPDTAMQIAELLDLDPLKCIGSVQLELAQKQNNQKHINLWKQYA